MSDSTVPGVLPRHSLQALYREHHGWLLGWLRQKLSGAEQASDLAQDTFLRLMAQRQPVEALRTPRAYLTTVAHGLLVNYWRRQDLERAWLEALASLPEPLAASPEEQALALEALQAVDAMLSRLPARVREAFLLSQLDGLKYAEIALRLGVSERMVKKYMAQAMLQCLLLDVRD